MPTIAFIMGRLNEQCAKRNSRTQFFELTYSSDMHETITCALFKPFVISLNKFDVFDDSLISIHASISFL